MQKPCLLQICPEAGLSTISRALWCGSSPLTIYNEIVEATERGNSAVKQEMAVEAQFLHESDSIGINPASISPL